MAVVYREPQPVENKRDGDPPPPESETLSKSILPYTEMMQ